MASNTTAVRLGSSILPEGTRVYGPYTQTSGRKLVQLVFPDGKKLSTSYARFLMSEKLGRPLSKDETVDHIDGDCTNDDPANLQIMSLGDNIRKSIPRLHA